MATISWGLGLERPPRALWSVIRKILNGLPVDIKITARDLTAKLGACLR